ncbi:hypothetical protein ACFL6W_10380 [Thermodesulfobacteriota bacterium]
MFFTIVLCLFPVTGIVIFLYIRSTFQLLEDLQNNAPEVWEKLGKPKRVGAGTMDTIKPLFPWVGWVWKGESEGLPVNIAHSLIKTRKLFKGGLGLFSLTVVFILLSIAMGE